MIKQCCQKILAYNVFLEKKVVKIVNEKQKHTVCDSTKTVVSSASRCSCSMS